MHSSLSHARTAARTCNKSAPVAAPFSLRIMIQRPGDAATCMAHPRRVAKVSSQIQREISEMFIYDKVVQEAICPEKRQGLDDKLSAVASVTHVYVSNDLQVVKAYVSVYSDDRGKERAINNLKRIAPYVRSRIGQALKLRLTPEVRFEYDDTLDELEKIQEAIGQDDFNRYIAEAEAEARGLSGSSSSSSAAGAAAAAVDNALDYEDDEDEDSGFFDIDADAASSSEAAAAAGSSSSSKQQVSWSKHDPATFFAVDEDEEAEEEDLGGAWYSRAGPFDDMFGGSGDELAEQQPKQQQQQPKQQQQQKVGGAPKKQRWRQRKAQAASEQ